MEFEVTNAYGVSADKITLSIEAKNQPGEKFGPLNTSPLDKFNHDGRKQDLDKLLEWYNKLKDKYATQAVQTNLENFCNTHQAGSCAVLVKDSLKNYTIDSVHKFCHIAYSEEIVAPYDSYCFDFPAQQVQEISERNKMLINGTLENKTSIYLYQNDSGGYTGTVLGLWKNKFVKYYIHHDTHLHIDLK